MDVRKRVTRVCLFKISQDCLLRIKDEHSPGEVLRDEMGERCTASAASRWNRSCGCVHMFVILLVHGACASSLCDLI